MIHVCLCFTDSSGSYYKNALTAMASIFKHSTSEVRVHLITDDTLNDEKKACFEQLCRRYEQEIAFHIVKDDILPKAIPLEHLRHFGKGALYRLLAPEIIIESRVLYLDCDTICTMDLEEIFQWDMGEACVAAVMDKGPICGSAKYRISLGLKGWDYFNSGVLLMDLEKLRTRHPDLRADILSRIAKGPLRFPDQDALNLYFASHPESLIVLPERFNYLLGINQREFLPLESLDGKIIHYVNAKPWRSACPAAFLFWKHYALACSVTDFPTDLSSPLLDEYMHLAAFIGRNKFLWRMTVRLHQLHSEGLKQTLLDRLLPGRKKQSDSLTNGCARYAWLLSRFGQPGLRSFLQFLATRGVRMEDQA